MGSVSVLSVVAPRQDLAGDGDTDAALVGRSLVALKDQAFLFGAYEQASAVNVLFTAPEIVWEASPAIWLVT